MQLFTRKREKEELIPEGLVLDHILVEHLVERRVLLGDGRQRDAEAGRERRALELPEPTDGRAGRHLRVRDFVVVCEQSRANNAMRIMAQQNRCPKYRGLVVRLDSIAETHSAPALERTAAPRTAAPAYGRVDSC